MGCAGILTMPNTDPPVAKVFQDETELPYWSIEAYLDMLRIVGGDSFDDIIVPLYLTQNTTPDMIAKGAESGLLRACKYYPPHGTFGAQYGRPLAHYMENGVFSAMEEHGIVLCVHGEEHGMRPEDYFARNINAEEYFYRERMPRLIDQYPSLKIVAEHLSTRIGVDLVRQAGKNATASVTPQHLLHTVGDLLQGLKYHLYCLPLLKFEEDRDALRRAVMDPFNTQFFAGTDSAPHAKKVTSCGCAAGCFTGGIAPQLYAMAFEAAGVDLATAPGQKVFTDFLCKNGPAFYGLLVEKKTFTMIKDAHIVRALETPDGEVAPLMLGEALPWRLSLESASL